MILIFADQYRRNPTRLYDFQFHRGKSDSLVNSLRIFSIANEMQNCAALRTIEFVRFSYKTLSQSWPHQTNWINWLGSTVQNKKISYCTCVLNSEHKSTILFQTIQELKSKIVEEWNNLPQKKIKKLCKSIPERLIGIQRKDTITKYCRII